MKKFSLAFVVNVLIFTTAAAAVGTVMYIQEKDKIDEANAQITGYCFEHPEADPETLCRKLTHVIKPERECACQQMPENLKKDMNCESLLADL